MAAQILQNSKIFRFLIFLSVFGTAHDPRNHLAAPLPHLAEPRGIRNPGALRVPPLHPGRPGLLLRLRPDVRALDTLGPSQAPLGPQLRLKEATHAHCPRVQVQRLALLARLTAELGSAPGAQLEARSVRRVKSSPHWSENY